MSQCRCNTLAATIVERYHTTVGERQLNLTLALLACNLTCHRTVYLVREPVLTSHGLQLQHTLQIFIEPRGIVNHGLVESLHGRVAHDGLRRVAEHLCHIEVEGLRAIGLAEREVSIARSLTHHIKRSTFALGNLPHVVDVLLVDEQTHAFLTLVGNDFLGRKRLVADGQLSHFNLTAALLDQLREAVQMACRAMVVNGDNGILVFFHQCTHEVVGALLHLRIGTLHSIQLDAIAIATRVDRRYRSATESDAIVVATDNHHLISFLRFLLQAVALLAIAHAACQHNHLIISILLLSLLMFEGEHGARDERLTELITEVAGTVRGLDENLLGRLIEPLANGQ